MSIALDMKVAALEQRVADLELQVRTAAVSPYDAVDLLAQRLNVALERLTDLEQTAARKTGPKPKGVV